MDSAKNTVSSFLNRGGQTDTEVDEVVNPAVVSETVKPQRHEEVTEAIDREVHQHHYHTTVQPIADREVLPERHTHNLGAAQEREFQHGDSSAVRDRIAREAEQFQNTLTTADTQFTTSHAPTAVGEHTRHHIHEVVQPVVHKEVYQPEVVHTTVPIHEKHLAPSEHHGLSTLPPKTLDEFTSSGGSLKGGEHHHQTEHLGDPRAYNPTYQVERHDVDKHFSEHDGTHDMSHKGHDHETIGGTVGYSATPINATSSGSTGTFGGFVPSTGTSTDRGLTGITGSGPTSSYAPGTTGTDSGVGSGLTGSGHPDSSYTTSSEYSRANPNAMGSGVAGVGAGAAAADLGRDHTRAGHNTDLSARDLTSNTDSLGSTGTALGGRTEGNTSSGASDHARGSHDDSHLGSEAAGSGNRRLEPSDRELEREPTNFSGGRAGEVDDSVQHASRQGKDPAMVGEKIGKLTGSGADGSHSAVFGLTPDGHTYDDTAHTSTSPQPAHGKETSSRNQSSSEDTGSRGAAGGGVADQMHDPRVAEKGHSGASVSATGSEKPGAGRLMPEQGTGTVKPGENNTGAASQSQTDPRY